MHALQHIRWVLTVSPRPAARSGTATHPPMARTTHLRPRMSVLFTFEQKLLLHALSLAGTWAEGRFEAALLYLLSPQLDRAGHPDRQPPPAFPPALAAWRPVARARPPLAPRASAAARQQARQTTKRQMTKRRRWCWRRWCSHRWCSHRRRRRATQRGMGAPVTAMGMPLVAVYQGVQCANRGVQCATAAAPLATAAAHIGDDAAVGERGAPARLALAVVPGQG